MTQNIEWLERKYITLLGMKLKQFKQKSVNQWNCRCPLCLDSTHDEYKARGYFLHQKDHYLFYCHNCMTHKGMGIKNLLKCIDYPLYQAMQMEAFEYFGKGKKDHITIINQKLHFQGHSDAEKALKRLQKISQLSPEHPAKQYIEKRKIPNEYHSIFRWSPNFMEWTNSIVPNKFSKASLRFDQGRIIIPFFDIEQKFFAFTGRAIDQTEKRYILIVLDHDIPCLYGMNRIDFQDDVYVVEGPIDSIFLPNCLAMAGSNINGLTFLEKPDKFIVIFDNEPRSKEARKKIEYAIEQGFRTTIWPSYIEHKDINEMMTVGGLSPDYIKSIIDKNTFAGLEAKIRLSAWSKV